MKIGTVKTPKFKIKTCKVCGKVDVDQWTCQSCRDKRGKKK